MRRSLWALLFVLLGLPIVFGVAAISWFASLVPTGQAARVTGPHSLVGVDTNGSFAWVVPVVGGVVLVDAGLDPAGLALKKEVAGRKVLAVLLTHAHADHTAALGLYPDAPVWLAPADQPYLNGTLQETTALATGFRMFAGTPAIHGPVNDVADGQDVLVGGEVFHAVSVPGVTPGSVAWLWRDVLFTGDAVWGGGSLLLPPAQLCENVTDAAVQPKRLLALDFDTIADGQVGLTRTARPALFRLLGETPAPPTYRAAGGTPAADPHTGWLVRAPTPDSAGAVRDWLVSPGRPPIPLTGAPTVRDGWVDRWVTLEGLRNDDSSLDVRVVREPVTPAPPSALPTTSKNLESWTGRFVEVQGTVRTFAPLVPGALWGEGTLELANGDVVPLAAPVARIPSTGPLSLLVRVQHTDAGVALVAAGS